LLFVGTCVYGDDDFGVGFRGVARRVNIPSPRYQKLLQTAPTRYNISVQGSYAYKKVLLFRWFLYQIVHLTVVFLF
jgi:hypothetical protein